MENIQLSDGTNVSVPTLDQYLLNSDVRQAWYQELSKATGGDLIALFKATADLIFSEKDKERIMFNELWFAFGDIALVNMYVSTKRRIILPNRSVVSQQRGNVFLPMEDLRESFIFRRVIEEKDEQ